MIKIKRKRSILNLFKSGAKTHKVTVEFDIEDFAAVENDLSVLLECFTEESKPSHVTFRLHRLMFNYWLKEDYDE